MDLYPWESCGARENAVAGSWTLDRSMPAAGAAGHDPGLGLRQANFLPAPAFSPEPGPP